MYLCCFLGVAGTFSGLTYGRMRLDENHMGEHEYNLQSLIFKL